MQSNPLTDSDQSVFGFSSHMAYENVISNQLEIFSKDLDQRMFKLTFNLAQREVSKCIYDTLYENIWT